MKNINELTELEINNLTDNDVELIIKYKKAEEGIKFISEPKCPDFIKIPEKDLMVYQIKVLGNNLVFSDIEDITKLKELISKSKGVFRVEYGVSSTYYATNKLFPYSEEWDEISTQNVYSKEIYDKVKENFSLNEKMKKEYEDSLKEYKEANEYSKEIEKEIWERVYEVRNKFIKLENYSSIFVKDYFLLADKNIDMAMKFMNKAYSLSYEEEKYILLNYKKFL